jgi:hypothetical protein
MKHLRYTLAAWIFLFCYPLTVFADQKRLYLSVGDEEEVSLPSDFYGKKNGRGQWSNHEISAIDIIRKSDYSIKFKVTKWVYHTCLIQYDYWYTDDNNYSRHITFDLIIDIKKPYVGLSANPSGGRVKKGSTVYLSCTKNGAEIYYSLDGYTPTKSSYKYSLGITIDKTCTLKAFASWGGVDSEILTENYIVDDLYLTVDPLGGVVEKGTTVYLNASEFGAEIYYTLDGYTPSKYSTPYTSSGIMINEDCTLKAIAYKNNKVSEVLSVSYFLPVNPIGISVSLSSSSIEVGKTAKAGYTLRPWNARSDVDWSSENPNIAVVSRTTGKVTGVSAGTTIIRATTANGLSADCTVTVYGEGENGIIINEENFPNEDFRDYLINCFGGILSEEEIEKTTKMEINYVWNLNLKGIEFFKNLKWLKCYGNRIVSLDLSKNTALEKLELAHNCLWSLDVSNNKSLTFIDCSNNFITGDKMDAFIRSLPENKESSKNVLRVILDDEDEDNVCTSIQVSTAIVKGWMPYYYTYFSSGGRWVEYQGSKIEYDLNGDGKTDDADILYIVECIMGKRDFSEDQMKADVNGDNKVNAADIVLIVNKIK